MGKKLTILFFCFALIVGAFLPQSVGMASSGSFTISADIVNVRGGPGLSYPLIKQAKRGETYTVLKKNGDWLEINLSSGTIGWVANWLVSGASNTTSMKTMTGIVNVPTLNVRNSPQATGTVIGKLTNGMTITVNSTQNNWAEIQFAGQSGWVSSQFIDLRDSSSTESPGGAIGKVTASSLSVRSNGSLNSKIIGSVMMGQSYTILEEKNNWDKIEYEPGSYGWVAAWYLDKTTASTETGQAMVAKTITILHNGTNIRKGADVQTNVLQRANAGDTFPVSRIEKDWYVIKLKNGNNGYVAGWLVSVNGNEPGFVKPGAGAYLKDKTIVIDPGHGGVDNGTTGVSGTMEKNLTIRTARLLYDKLKAAGANVVLTRNSDTYISLPSRVSTAIATHADAFVSLHYDANADRSVRGMTGYYYYPYQKTLANYLYTSTANQTKLWNRGVRFGTYHVIRENPQKATLIELGYLSNPEEEMTLNSIEFQENAATGIFNGLARYFKEN